MVKRYIHFLHSKSNGKIILWLLIVYLLFPLAIFPLSGRLQQEYAGNSTPPLDLEFGFTAEQAFNRVEQYGKNGRFIYAISALTADVAYPAVYSAFLALLIIYFGNQSGLDKRWQDLMARLPLAAAIADLFENAGIVALLVSYPARNPWLAGFTSLANMTKWILITGTLLVIVLILIKWLIKLITNR